ncbi:hypothetical protein Tco_0583114 [Tanacetum coccineum]
MAAMGMCFDHVDVMSIGKCCHIVGVGCGMMVVHILEFVVHVVFFHVQDMPEQVGVGEFSPSYYISQLGDSLIISGSFGFGDFRIIYAWALDFQDGFISSCSLLFTIPHPAGHFLKLLGFDNDNEQIGEAKIVQQWYRSLQVFHPIVEGFMNIGVEEVDINKKTENQAKMTKLSMEWKRLCKIKAKVQKYQSQSQYRRISSQTEAGTEEYYWMQS